MQWTFIFLANLKALAATVTQSRRLLWFCPPSIFTIKFGFGMFPVVKFVTIFIAVGFLAVRAQNVFVFLQN